MRRGEGCPNVSFILSKIAIFDRIKKAINPLPLQSNDKRRREGAKTLHFGITEIGRKGGPNSIYFCARLWLEKKAPRESVRHLLLQLGGCFRNMFRNRALTFCWRGEGLSL